MHARFAALLRFVATLLFCGVACAYTITVSPVPVNGTVTTSVGGINCGTGGSACTSSDITPNTSVTMTATPDAGYHFVQWQPPFGSNQNPLTFPIPSSVTGTAIFSFTTVNVTSVFPSSTTAPVGGSRSMTVTVNPAPVSDTVVSLDAQPIGVVSVPSTVTVLAGNTQATFPVTGVSSGTATLTATLGASFQTGSIVVIPTAVVPDAPQAVSAFAFIEQAQVVFSGPVSDGGSPITSYTATSSPGGFTGTVAADPFSPGPPPIFVTGLTGGTSYTFTVTATNAIGTSAASAPSNAVVPSARAAPSEPANCIAGVSGPLRITVACDPPASDGGASITSYTATSSPGGITASAPPPGAPGPISIDVTALTRGVAYTFTVTATNAVGTGAASLPTLPVTAVALPGAPTGVTAVGGVGTITINWTAPADDGGDPISKYTVYVSGVGTDVLGAASYVLQNAAPGVPMSFTVTATNSAGEGPPSLPSNTATASASPPGAPTSVHAMARPGSATVSFVAPASNGGGAITGYVVTASPGGQTASAAQSPIDVDGLINGTSYTFTVAAQNVAGTGASSAASNLVTPNALGPRLSPYAYVTCAADNLVAVIDTAANRVITTIHVGAGPVGLAVNAAGTRVYVANETAGTVSVIDATTNTVIATIPTSSTPYGVALNPAGTRLYVTDPVNHRLSTFDTQTNLLLGSVNLVNNVLDLPGIIAVHPSGSPVYVVDNAASTLFAIDATTNAVAPLSVTGPVMLAFAPGGGTLYVTRGNGLSSIVGNTLTGTTILPEATQGIAVNPVSGRQYVSLPNVNQVVTVDSGIVGTSIPVGTTPNGVAVTPTGSRVFVANVGDGTVSVINATNNAVMATIPVGRQPAVVGAFVGPPPTSVPDAPPTVVATPGNAEASVAFVAPANDGGVPILSYTATSSPGGITATGSTSPIVVSGLANGTTYTFTVTATNAVGTGPSSPPSNSVTPGTIPGAPTSVSALAGDARTTISFSSPVSNGGFAITSYGVLCTPGPVTASGASSPIVVNGLTNGTTYSCTVSATNSAGTGPVSAPVSTLPLAAGVFLAPSSSPLDFGAQSLGTTTFSRTVTFTNLRGAAIALGAASITSGYTIAANTCTGTLGAGGTCQVSVTFTPSSVGSIAGQLSVSYSDGGPTIVNLAGVGELSLSTHYYQSILNRDPDASGKAFWDGEAARMASLGADLREAYFVMANYFFNSAEYLAAHKTDTQFVTDLYNTFFNRPPDAGGLNYWLSQIQGGLPRDVVLFSFMFSPEFGAFTTNIFGNVAARPEVNVVMDFFRGVLNRLPDTNAFNFWVGQLKTAQCQGAGAVYNAVNAMSYQFIFGAEYTNRARNNTQYVTDLYNAFLRRGGDTAGVQFWVNQLDTNAQDRNTERANFIASPEFGARVTATIQAGCSP